mmetsp:Transcript_12593/g.31952  ORF Transcript_12593/g.31952 Transcript_12593/m.31952 type:complete len:515 (-) Transcript_12593:43-1587(-)
MRRMRGSNALGSGASATMASPTLQRKDYPYRAWQCATCQRGRVKRASRAGNHGGDARLAICGRTAVKDQSMRKRLPFGHVIRAALDDIVPEVDLWEEDATALKEAQIASGAEFAEGDAVPLHFTRDKRLPYAKVRKGCFVCDVSNKCLLRVSGGDRLEFLHNQSTASVRDASEGAVIDTAFVNAQARLIDLATLYVQKNSILILASPGNESTLISHLEKHVFFRDDVHIEDISSELSIFHLLGEKSVDAVRSLKMVDELGQASFSLLNFQGYPVIIASGSGSSMDGFTLMVHKQVAGELWELLMAEEDLSPIGSEAWERLRIMDGRPGIGAEISSDYNPLEAGLYHCVDLEKGCSIGQEAISKISNRGAVRSRLWGLRAPDSSSIYPGQKIMFDGTAVGSITSSFRHEHHGSFAMGYIKTRSKRAPATSGDGGGWEGSEVSVIGSDGTEAADATVTKLSYPNYPILEVDAQYSKPDAGDTGAGDSGDSTTADAEERRSDVQRKVEEWLKQNKQQ